MARKVGGLTINIGAKESGPVMADRPQGAIVNLYTKTGTPIHVTLGGYDRSRIGWAYESAAFFAKGDPVYMRRDGTVSPTPERTRPPTELVTTTMTGNATTGHSVYWGSTRLPADVVSAEPTKWPTSQLTPRAWLKQRVDEVRDAGRLGAKPNTDLAYKHARGLYGIITSGAA